MGSRGAQHGRHGRPQTEEPGRRQWWSRVLWPGVTSRRSWVWKVAAPVAFACAGMLAITSAINAQGTDLRGGRHTSLIELVSSEREQVAAQEAKAEALQHQVDALADAVSDGQVAGLQKQIERVGASMGMSALRGPGLVVTLSDAPRGEDVPKGTDPDLLVVHQQDIQAVANALWAGGAEGISLQGNRIISTTGIKCVGNTVVLQGVPYAPPYRIVAVGRTQAMYQALFAAPEVQNYLDYVPAPYHLGWSLRLADKLTVPGFSGSTSLEYARPIGG